MKSNSELKIDLFSFGYKHDPPKADTVIDVRFLPNPYYVPELSPKTGVDNKVASYVLDNQIAEQFFSTFVPFLNDYIQGHAKTKRQSFCLAIGCTGGRHRSVAVAESLNNILKNQGVKVTLSHRDIEKL